MEPQRKDDVSRLDLDANKGDGPTIREFLASGADAWSPEVVAKAHSVVEAFVAWRESLLRPGTLSGDLARLFGDHWVDAEREAAIAHVAARLVQQGRHPSTYEGLTSHLPAALLLLADTSREVQPIHFAGQPKPVKMPPVELAVDVYLQWLRIHLPRAGIAHLLGREYPPRNDALSRSGPLTAKLPEPTASIELLMDQEDWGEWYTALEGKASPRQRELLHLLKDEVEHLELLPLLEGKRRRNDRLRGIKQVVAKRMGVTPSRVSHMLTQLRKLAQGL